MVADGSRHAGPSENNDEADNRDDQDVLDDRLASEIGRSMSAPPRRSFAAACMCGSFRSGLQYKPTVGLFYVFVPVLPLRQNVTNSTPARLNQPLAYPNLLLNKFSGSVSKIDNVGSLGTALSPSRSKSREYRR